MKISMGTNEKSTLMTRKEVEDNADEGVYMSDLHELDDDYEFVVIIKDHMGDCIGLGRSLDGKPYVFNNISDHVEFEGGFYLTNNPITIQS